MSSPPFFLVGVGCGTPPFGAKSTDFPSEGVPVQLDMPHERLTQLVRQYGAAAADSGQIQQRLKKLLPTRLVELKQEHTRAGRRAHAERLALADPRYVSYLEEYVAIMGHTLEARVQYETSLMLIEARRSLRALRLKAKPPRALDF